MLNLGSGPIPLHDHVNLDLIPYPGVDVVHDLNFRWPFLPARFSSITASHIVEHLISLVFFFNEAWRVLQPGGSISITVPWFAGRWAAGDPFHLHNFNHATFDPWTRNHARFALAGLRGPWEEINRVYLWDPTISPGDDLAKWGYSLCLGYTITLRRP